MYTVVTAESRPQRRELGRANRFFVGRSIVVVAAAGLLAAASHLPASAAPGDQAADTVTVNVGVTSSISLSGLTPAFTLTGLPNSSVVEPNAVAYTVTTNNVGGYTVTVQSADASLDPTVNQGNNDSIPITNLEVQADGAGAYTALSNTSAVTLQTQATRSAPGGDAYADDYRVTIPFVADDVYQTTLDYIATAS